MKLWTSLFATITLGVLGAQTAFSEDLERPDTATIIAKLRAASIAHGLPAELAQAVGFVETAFDPTLVGAAGEVGVMQVMPPTAAGLGFAGTTAELADVDTNIRYGVQYLAKAWELADHDLCRTLNKYRAGHGSETLSPLSLSYCARARAYLATLRSPLAAGAVASVENLDAERNTAAAPPSRKLRGPAFWANQEARVRRLDAQVRARWTRIAAHNARVATLGGGSKRAEF